MIGQISFFGIFSNVYVFLTIMIFIAGVIGAVSRALPVAAFSGFLVFVYIGVNAELPFFTNFMLVVVTLIVLLIAFQSWQMYTGSES